MTENANQPSVLVIGARRANQGIGEFVARWFAQEGARVTAIVGTRPNSILEARDTLRQNYGIECNGYANLSEALDKERPDIVAICSPFTKHRDQLLRVAEAGAHCLCEKPMWWDETMSDSSRGREASVREQTERLVDAFEERGLALSLVTQWPQTLETYYQIYPELRGEPVRSFDMLMGPTQLGPRMVLDAVPHVLSMLQALVGVGTVEAPRVAIDPALETLTLGFVYVGSGSAKVEARCEFRQTPSPPRPAAYAINGHRVDRAIQLPDYDMFFEGSGKKRPLPDPLQGLIEQFLAQIVPAGTTDRAALVEGMAALDYLYSETERALQSR